MSNSLSFHSTKFDVIDQNAQPWLLARQIGIALGYTRSDAILNLYERNKDEFSPAMTRTIEMMVGGQPTLVRIFSLRGCHLLAMFARTDVAKAFRKWVLDVLETLNKPEPQPALPSPTLSPEQQRQLHDIMDAKVKMLAPELSGKARAEAWTRFNRHFRISKYEQLPAGRFSEGAEYLINMALKTAAVVAAVPLVDIHQRRLEVEAALHHMGDALRAFYADLAHAVPSKSYHNAPREIGNAAKLTHSALDAMDRQLETVQLAATVAFDVYRNAAAR